MKHTPHGTCRLCEKPSELQNSHILPAAAHAHTKLNGKNTFVSNRKLEFKLNNQRDHKEYLLCFECEQFLSRFEGTAVQFCRAAWKGRAKLVYEIPPHVVPHLISFAYSVFWRTSVSTIFGGYNLGPEVENTLKYAFYRGQPPAPPLLALTVFYSQNTKKKDGDKICMTPLVLKLPMDICAHYFSMFGIVFRMDVPNSLYELEQNSYLRHNEQTGCVYHPREEEVNLLQYEHNRSLAVLNGMRVI